MLISPKIWPFLLALFLLSFEGVSDDDVETKGVVKHVRGKASIGPKGQEKPLKKGDKFDVGDVIKTMSKSFAILVFPEGSTIKLDPNSELKIDKIMRPKKKGFTDLSSVVLKAGGAMVDVIRVFSGPPSLEVKTRKNLSLGVRGTSFYTFVDKKTSDQWLVVKEGKMQVYDMKNDDSEWVPKDNSLALLKGKSLTKPYRYQWVKGLRWNKNPAKGSLGTMAELTAPFRRNELSRVLSQVRSRQRKRVKASMTKLLNDIKGQIRYPVKIYKIDDNYNHLGADEKEKERDDPLKKIPKNVYAVSAGEQANSEAKNLCQEITDESGFGCKVQTAKCTGQDMQAAVYYDDVNKVPYNVCVQWSGAKFKL